MVNSSNQFSGSNDFTYSGAPMNYTPDLKLEPIHMKLDLNFDIENRTVTGTNTITVKSNLEGSNFIQLDAVDFDELAVEGDQVDFEYNGKHIDVTLKKSLDEGSTIDIVIQYTVSHPVAGLYFSYPDAKYPNRPISVASDHETERARYWMPCVDSPVVRTTFEQYLTSKKEYTILGMGRKVSEEVKGEIKTAYWKHDFPCPSYISVVAIGDFIEYQDRDADAGNGPIPVAYYTSKNYTSDDLKRAFDRTPEMIEWIVEKFGSAMAWAKYYQYSLATMGGAMENHTLVSWNDFAILTPNLAKEYDYRIDSVNIHEMAHTFFGDMIVIRDWQHAWLKESWATYVSALWFEDNESQDMFDYDMYKNANAYFSEADGKYIRAIVHNRYHSSWELFDNHLYPGGAWRLHMLRKMLGDEIFFVAVKDYVATYIGKTVETVDFRRKLEFHSKRNLEEFFDQWVLAPKGYPKIKFSFKYSDKDNLGIFTIEQTQVKDDKDEIKYNPFVFDLDVAWSLGEDYICQTKRISEKKQEFSFQLTDKPHHVRIDPFQKVLFKEEVSMDDEYLINQLHAPDVVGRVKAAFHLAKTGKRKNVEAIGTSYADQTFYGVKLEYIKALNDSNSRFAIPYLVEIIRTETEVRTTSQMFTLLSNFIDEGIRDAIIYRLKAKESDEPGKLLPSATQNALTALGNFRDKTTETILKEFTTQDGEKYTTRIGAYSGLMKSRNKELLAMLTSSIAYGNQPEQIRNRLIRSISSFANWFGKLEKKQVEDALLQILKEENYQTRYSAIVGLETLKATSAIPNIQRAKGAFPQQTQVTIHKLINKIRKHQKQDNKYADLNDKLEKVNTTLQKLEERIANLEKSEK